MKKTLYIFLSLIFFLSVSSCTDDFPLGDYEIGEGEAVLSATVNFHPLVGTKVDTGQGGRAAAGNALNDLTDITVFVYKESGHLFNIYSGDDLLELNTTLKDTAGANTDMPSDAGEKAEETTARASFTLKGIPYGRYNIYVTANIPFDKEQAKRDFENVADLKKFCVKWNEENIAANDQMFGYFSETGESDGFDAYPVIINKKQMQLHAWIKRAASKVTVVFDGSGLKNDVWIYIKDVRIKDIPRYCKIGEDNSISTKAGARDSMIVNGDVLNYNADGYTDKDPGGDYTKWLEISKGSGKKGAVEKDPVTGAVTEHSEYAPALYFYENIQGDYPGQKKYDKHQDWDKVGYIPKPEDDDYKDNIPYGTYIEVEAYYISQNPENVTHGRIIYRFMLGQDVDYNYNAIRNHHYKLTLGFKGWANQPDWHIAYVEQDPTIFTNPTYYVSYMYNQKALFPVRILGDVQEFEVEIVENNWAPFDSTQVGNVPPKEIKSTVPGELDFQWNKTVYDGSQYYYGLQTPWNIDGTKQVAFTAAEIKKGAPEKATPVWAGFLALQVPGSKPEDIDAFLMPAPPIRYNDANQIQSFKNYFYNRGPVEGVEGVSAPGVQQNYRKFTTADLTFSEGQDSKTVGSGNNECKITKAKDGSITVNLPMWTRPKSMLGISGFSGNNPYDTYQRRAIVKLTATYKSGKKVVRFRPVYQVRRIVNPKAVWRKWDDNTTFNVKLMRREGAAAAKFSAFNSEGAWRAYVKTVSEGADGFITLTGGSAKAENAGEVRGNTGTPIDFTINFNGKGKEKSSLCAIIEVEYHGYTCKHSIYVRQGYFQPLDIVPGKAKWSSFSLYKTDDPVAFGTQWDASKKNYIPAQMTASPLSLGSLFKRGNYNGIYIENNTKEDFGPREKPGRYGLFDMTDGDQQYWAEIQGYPYATGYSGSKPYASNTIQYKFAWGRFKSKVAGEQRYYRVPNFDDFNALMTHCEYGIGVMYGDGSTITAENVSDAFGFEDFNNNGQDNNPAGTSTRGMRGIMVYNPSNAHQLFFPIGARGIGRRTITGFTAAAFWNFGVLRYGAVSTVLDQANNVNNQYRPIPFNLPASPGAIYWIAKTTGEPNHILGWDMNYFDMNFNGYDYAISFSQNFGGWGESTPNPIPSGMSAADYAKTHGGDALPIKLVLDESASSN